MLDGFNLALISIVLLIVLFIILAIRRTMSKITQSGLTRDEARRLAERIRGRDIECP